MNFLMVYFISEQELAIMDLGNFVALRTITVPRGTVWRVVVAIVHAPLVHAGTPSVGTYC